MLRDERPEVMLPNFVTVRLIQRYEGRSLWGAPPHIHALRIDRRRHARVTVVRVLTKGRRFIFLRPNRFSVRRIDADDCPARSAGGCRGHENAITPDDGR